MLIENPEQMKLFAKDMAKKYSKILLKGELGAGKTLFTKGFAQQLGIDENNIKSPTYTYLNIYEDRLLHIDMYRLESFEDLLDKGILEEIHNYEFIVIERPKFFDNIDYDGFHLINIEKLSDNVRKIT